MWSLPAENLGYWEPGTDVGVEGGIAQYLAGGENDRATTGDVFDITASPFFAAGNSNETTGSITEDSDELTVADASGFAAGNHIEFGLQAIHTLTVTAGASATGNAVIWLGTNSGSFITVNVPVVSGDTIAQVAAKIRAITVVDGRVTVSGSGNDAIFTNPNCGPVVTSQVVNFGTGVTGTFVVTQAGTLYEHKIESVAGNVLTLTVAAADSVTGAKVQHNDRVSIKEAIAAAGSGDLIYIPAGTYRIGNGLNEEPIGFITTLYKDNITIRGAGPSSILYGSTIHPVIQFSDPGGLTYYPQAVTGGSKAKGSTTLNIADTSGYVVGMHCRISYENETDETRIEAGAAPVWNSVGFPWMRAYTHKITAVVANTSISFDPPLAADGTDLDMMVGTSASSSLNEGWGFEDFSITFDAINHPSVGISMTQSAQCWAHNLNFPHWMKATSSGSCIVNYLSYRNEVRHCTFHADDGFATAAVTGSDGAIGTGGATSCLYEDNIFSGAWDITIYDNGAALNCVTSYNYVDGPQGSYFHNAHPSLNIFEGNISAGHQSDGYHGSSSHNTFFRNWHKGQFPMTLNRFKRNYVLAGNIFGVDGTYDGQASWGNPNIGNGIANGYAGPTGLSLRAGTLDYWQVVGGGPFLVEIEPEDIFAGDFWQDWNITATLTTRTSDTVGVFTVSNGDFFVGGNSYGATLLVSVWWGNEYPNVAFNGIVNAVSGSDVTITFAGYVLPAEDTPILRVHLGPTGWQERDLDVEASSTVDHNYESEASGTGVIVNSISPDTFPDSLVYSEKPAFFGILDWPPIDPDNYDTNIERIPAGYRFVNEEDPPLEYEYEIDADRLPATGTWEAAGVPGGIPTDRTTIYATITATGSDQATEIQTALNNCPSGQVVKLAAGTFRCDVMIAVPGNVTLRGTVNSSGVPISIIDSRAGTGLQIGNAHYDLTWPVGGANLVSASLTKGATTIQVDDASQFAANHIAMIRLGVDETIPLINTYGGDRGRGQIVRIVSINTASSPDTITIEAPGLHGDYTTSGAATIIGGQGLYITGAAAEDLLVTGVNGGATMQLGISFASCYASWALNCISEYAENYGISIGSSYPGIHKCEIRHCRSVGRNLIATSNAGFFIGAVSSVLFIDNIIEEWTFSMLQQGQASGNVIAENFWINTDLDYTVADGNHAACPQFTLYEGNVGSAWQSDGYYGGSLYDTHFRNWWMGTRLGISTDLFSIVGNRFTRYLNVLGNQFGKTGVSEAPPVGWGNPNMSNGSSSGNPTSRRGTYSTLSTRTNATSGTITAPSGHGVVSDSTIDLVWQEFDTPYYVAKVRRGVLVGTVSGTSIPFSGGEGHDLPAEDEGIFVPTTNSSLWTNDPDWDESEGRERWWTGILTTRSTDNTGIITLDPPSVQAASFAAALADAYEGFSGPQRGLKPASFNTNNASIEVTNLAGDVITFVNSSWSVLPDEDTAFVIVPSNFGLQGLDLDVTFTALSKGNYYGSATGSEIPAVESIAGYYFADSLFRTEEPDNYDTLPWPAIDPTDPTDDSYEIIPAGYRYVNGFDPGQEPSSGAPGANRTFRPNRILLIRRR